MKFTEILLFVVFGISAFSAQDSVRKQDDFYDSVNEKWLKEKAESNKKAQEDLANHIQ